MALQLIGTGEQANCFASLEPANDYVKFIFIESRVDADAKK